MTPESVQSIDRHKLSSETHQWGWKSQFALGHNTEGSCKMRILVLALTWWNGQIRTLGPEAYAMTWEVLKKKMTDKYCPQGEIKKLEIEWS
ncbi:hypothetical protein Tco_0773397 [Tanacetum coccineum]|uniref:Retrotransposon gag domain-containing protein n=1 Tax=Tanacetum coccineum TaxID=301880 RepID=A0ABQ4ZMW3_9ASTR